MSGTQACFRYEANDGISGKPFFLKNLDLNIDLESRLCLVGENGCGKSTLRIIFHAVQYHSVLSVFLVLVTCVGLMPNVGFRV